MNASDHLTQFLLETAVVCPPQLCHPEEDRAIRCLVCGHQCLIAEGKTGICRVRFNKDGKLLVPSRTIAGLQADPIEKKPFYHVLPGSHALSFGGLGCNFHCDFCQNWLSSQTLRDEQAIVHPRRIEPETLVELAIENQCPSIVATYNEPIISIEWVREVFDIARTEGLLCGMVSNGHASPESLDYIDHCTDMVKVDLKTFEEAGYRNLGGRLQVVLDTIASLVERKMHVEIVTLVVPGFNDSDSNLQGIASFIAGVSCSIPWHVTAFHPDYRMLTPPRTPATTLARAWEIGHEAGLHFVYAGNLPGGVGSCENTVCPGCSETLIQRTGFHVDKNELKQGKCPSCGLAIPGVWESQDASLEKHEMRGADL